MNYEEFLKIWQAVPDAIPISYRLYYDDQGHPLFYSMEDLPGNYIEVDAATYAKSSRRVRVRDGQLIHLKTVTAAKLVPGETGTCCHPQNVCIVVNEQQSHTKWSLKTYDTD